MKAVTARNLVHNRLTYRMSDLPSGWSWYAASFGNWAILWYDIGIFIKLVTKQTSLFTQQRRSSPRPTDQLSNTHISICSRFTQAISFLKNILSESSHASRSPFTPRVLPTERIFCPEHMRCRLRMMIRFILISLAVKCFPYGVSIQLLLLLSR
jgi:hypothetical protein